MFILNIFVVKNSNLSQNVWLCKKKQSCGRYAMFLKWTDTDRRAHIEYCRDQNGHILHIVPPLSNAAKAHNRLVMNTCQKLRTLKAAKFIELALSKNQQHTEPCITLLNFLHTYHTQQLQAGIRSASCTMRLIRIVSIFAPSVTLAQAAQKTFVVQLRNFLLHTYIIKGTSRHLSVNTVVLYLNVLRGAYSEAMRKKLIAENPFAQLTKRERLSPAPSARTALTPCELKRIRSTARTNETCRAFIFACLTGLRLSDIRDLQWCNIKKDNNRLLIDKVMVKTQRRIVVPLNSEAVSFLCSTPNNSNTPIFSLPRSASTISKHLQRAAQVAQVAHKVTFHCARHTFATLLATSSGDINITRQLLGHSNIRTTQIYLHTPTEAILRAVDQLPKILSE